MAYSLSSFLFYKMMGNLVLSYNIYYFLSLFNNGRFLFFYETNKTIVIFRCYFRLFIHFPPIVPLTYSIVFHWEAVALTFCL